jgi:hypothetical protein
MLRAMLSPSTAVDLSQLTQRSETVSAPRGGPSPPTPSPMGSVFITGESQVTSQPSSFQSTTTVAGQGDDEGESGDSNDDVEMEEEYRPGEAVRVREIVTLDDDDDSGDSEEDEKRERLPVSRIQLTERDKWVGIDFSRQDSAPRPEYSSSTKNGVQQAIRRAQALRREPRPKERFTILSIADYKASLTLSTSPSPPTLVTSSHPLQTTGGREEGDDVVIEQRRTTAAASGDPSHGRGTSSASGNVRDEHHTDITRQSHGDHSHTVITQRSLGDHTGLPQTSEVDTASLGVLPRGLQSTLPQPSPRSTAAAAGGGVGRKRPQPPKQSAGAEPREKRRRQRSESDSDSDSDSEEESGGDDEEEDSGDEDTRGPSTQPKILRCRHECDTRRTESEGGICDVPFRNVMALNRHEMASQDNDTTHLPCTMHNPCPAWKHHKNSLRKGSSKWKDWTQREAELGDVVHPSTAPSAPTGPAAPTLRIASTALIAPTGPTGPTAVSLTSLTASTALTASTPSTRSPPSSHSLPSVASSSSSTARTTPASAASIASTAADTAMMQRLEALFAMQRTLSVSSALAYAPFPRGTPHEPMGNVLWLAPYLQRVFTERALPLPPLIAKYCHFVAVIPLPFLKVHKHTKHTHTQLMSHGNDHSYTPPHNKSLRLLV